MGAWALAVPLALPGGARAQDVEAVSALSGIPLPAAYWEAVRRDPETFELPNGLFLKTAAGRMPSRPVAGTVRLPLILALFSDTPEPHITPAQIRASIFDGPAPSGTLTAFYLEMSRGAFRVEGDVLPWVRTTVTRSEALGNSFGLGGTVGPYLVQALARNDGALDFGRFDNDGPDGVPNSGDDDGIVDAVTFEFLEVSASCGGPGVWPHRSSLTASRVGAPYRTNDARAGGGVILVDAYIIQGATDCGGTQVQTAGTIAHEFGHVLGLPDYYHGIGTIGPENRRWVLGCWELMAAGSWGCGAVGPRVSFGPTHMTAHPKEALGWLELFQVGTTPSSTPRSTSNASGSRWSCSPCRRRARRSSSRWTTRGRRRSSSSTAPAPASTSRSPPRAWWSRTGTWEAPSVPRPICGTRSGSSRRTETARSSGRRRRGATGARPATPSPPRELSGS